MKTQHLALTGNIGSGKSTVSRIFGLLGIPIYDSDARAKALMLSNSTIREQLTSTFGAAAYFKNGRLNRAYLSKRVFSDSKALAAINSIVHPVVRADYLAWRHKQISPYTLQESALTFEIGSNLHMDGVIVVFASEDLLKKRVMQRDQSTAEQFKARISKQMNQKRKMEQATYRIDNSLGQLLLPQIHKIHLELLWNNALK